MKFAGLRCLQYQGETVQLRHEHQPRPLQWRAPSRSVGANDYVGVVMNVSPALGVMGILYAVFMIALAVLAVYTLVLVIIFLRLRIAEMKRAAQAEGGSQP